MNNEILIVGSLALDTVETPFGRVEEALGGAALYAATAASLFAPVHLVAVIGDDFPQQALDELAGRGVALKGVQCVEGGRSFRWSGRYEYDMNGAETLDTQLNVFADFNPLLPESARHCGYVFLANILPSLQLKVLDQVQQPRLTICDTMNFWIENARDELLEVLRQVDVATMNDAELRQLTGEPNLAKAATKALKMGPRYLILKKGEYGASLVAAQQLRQALAIGTVTASACVEDFSINALRKLTVDDLYSRYETLHEMVRFEEISPQAILPN